MSFWDSLSNFSDNIALIDEITEETVTYDALNSNAVKYSNKFSFDNKKLFLLFCDNSVENVILYTSILKSGNTVFLADSKMDESLRMNLINIYVPDFIIDSEKVYAKYSDSQLLKHYFLFERIEEISSSKIFEPTAVLLSTSGTTGSPKLVRLSNLNIESNANSIVEYLNIGSNERAITSLPMSYSYGLSIINSHLTAGASLLCTNKSIVTRDFWKNFDKFKCTSFAGVPYMYQTLQKIKFHTMNLPSLKTMTQAGGRLSEEYIKYFFNLSKEKGFNFIVMYGQTEATARISYVPYEKLETKIGSIGIPIPGGIIKLRKNSVYDDSGELVYNGKNVMLGYASNREDLSNDDELKGQLLTGDLARVDEDGFFYITGRTKRFLKIFGLRLNLDEVEKLIENQFQLPNACFGNDDKITVLVEIQDLKSTDIIKNKLIEIYKLHHSVIEIKQISQIPVTSSGKKDYAKIKEVLNLVSD